ncbi:MAG: hypothetical protein ABH846_03790 [Patescibacteria group bacterium]
MSAENEITVYRMSNDEWWVCVRHCGDTVVEAYGLVSCVLAKCDSYEEAIEAGRRFNTEKLHDPTFSDEDIRAAHKLCARHCDAARRKECNPVDNPHNWCGVFHDLLFEAATSAGHDPFGNSDDSYVYTEYGFNPPSKEQLLKQLPCYLASEVRLRFGDRQCDCLDHRDIPQMKWWVEEQIWPDWEKDEDGDTVYIEPRVLDKDLTFAEAVTLAQSYATRQPGKCELVNPPLLFKEFVDYDNHTCSLEDEWRLVNPRRRREQSS